MSLANFEKYFCTVNVPFPHFLQMRYRRTDRPTDRRLNPLTEMLGHIQKEKLFRTHRSSLRRRDPNSP